MRLLACAVLCFCLGVTDAVALTDSLVSYWEFNEASGTRFDSHETNHLTDNNTVGSAAGIVGTAADFEAANSEWLSIADNPSVSLGDIDFTYCGWLKLETNAVCDVISKHNGAAEIELYIGDTGVLRWYVENGASNEEIGNPLVLIPGTPYFFVAYHDAVNNEIGLQINDGVVASISYSGGVLDGTGDLRIGSAPAGALPYDGIADQFGFWKRMLTPAERTQLYNGGAGMSYAAVSAASPRYLLVRN